MSDTDKQLASMTYSGCQIMIVLPLNPNEDNQVEVILYAPDGLFCGHWQFSAELDPNQWLLEGLASAFHRMKSLGYLK